MSEGDILILQDGRIAKVADLDFPWEGNVSLYLLDKDDKIFLSAAQLKKVKILNSDNAKFQFELARSIHLRLNKLGRV